MWYFIGAAVLILLVLAFLKRSAYELEQLDVNRYTIDCGKIPNDRTDIRICFLSDLHDHLFGKENERLIEKVRQEDPDLILIGGDMMTVKKWSRSDFAALKYLLDGLTAYPVYYGDGNHESRMEQEAEFYPGWYEQLMSLFSAYPNVTYLKDECCRVVIKGLTFRICGLDLEEEYYRAVFKKKLRIEHITEKIGSAEDDFDIVLLHTPLYMRETAKWGADLTLSGHFHGGTVRLPLLGGVMTPQFQLFSRWCKGIFETEGRYGIVSAGLGTHTYNFRFLNKPEVVMIRLKRGEKIEP